MVNNIFQVRPNYKAKIGVMGSASGAVMRNPKAVSAAKEIGIQIAKQGCVLVNGACPGLPDEAAKGAKESGGETMGISPAISMHSHMVKYRSPIEHYDHFMFTGMGLMMRDIINIRSSNAVIILPGGTGTLNEFTVAYDEGKPIGVLTGHGGVADHITEILEFCSRKETSRMVMSDDPKELVKKVLEIAKNLNHPYTLDNYLLGDDGVITNIEATEEDKDGKKW